METAHIVLAEIVRGISGAAVDAVYRFSRKCTREYFDNSHEHERSQLYEYSKVALNSCSTMPSLIPGKGINTATDYIVPNIKLDRYGSPVFSSVRDALDKHRAIVVVGQGGIGKTAYLKRAYIELVHGRDRIPIYIELRRMRRLFELQLKQFGQLKHLSVSIRDFVLGDAPGLSSDGWGNGLRSGAFAFILDGVDELPHYMQEEICQRLAVFSGTYPACQFLFSSRPGATIVESNPYNMLQVGIEPFRREQVVELYEKHARDYPEITSRVVRRLTPELYAQFGGVLGVPLLAMLFYKDVSSGEKSAGLGTVVGFYHNLAKSAWVFQDLLKDRSFCRSPKLDFEPQAYEALIAEFSARMYGSHTEPFSMHLAIEKLSDCESVAHCDREVAVGFLTDMLQFFSFLVEDGDGYSFAHRSICEFFTAMYWASRPNEFDDLVVVEQMLSEWPADSCLYFLSQIAPVLYRTKAVFPIAEELIESSLAAYNTDFPFGMPLLGKIQIIESGSGALEIFAVHNERFVNALRFLNNAFRGHEASVCTEGNMHAPPLRLRFPVRDPEEFYETLGQCQVRVGQGLQEGDWLVNQVRRGLSRKTVDGEPMVLLDLSNLKLHREFWKYLGEEDRLGEWVSPEYHFKVATAVLGECSKMYEDQSFSSNKYHNKFD